MIEKGLAAFAVCVILGCAGRAVPAEAAGSLDCKPGVWVIGARGSGEKPNGDPGNTVGPFIEKLKHIAGRGAVGSEGLEYQAVGILDWRLAAGANTKALEYKVSVTGGVASLIKTVVNRAKGCDKQKLVLSGYSQGAEVVRKALPHLKRLADRIGAVVLFGDPQFDPNTRADKGGTYSPKRHGVLGLPEADFPAVFSHVVTYCRDGDLICEGFPNRTEGHKHYAPEMTTGAAVKVADWLGLFRAPAGRPAASRQSSTIRAPWPATTPQRSVVRRLNC